MEYNSGSNQVSDVKLQARSLLNCTPQSPDTNKFVSITKFEKPKSTVEKSQVSHDHRSFECNLSNCEQKPEKVRTSTGLKSMDLCQAQWLY